VPFAVFALAATCGSAAVLGYSDGAPAPWLKELPFVLTILVLAIACAREGRLRRASLLSPLVVVFLAYGFIFGVIPLVDLANDNPMVAVPGWWRCSWIVCAGAGLLVAGYLAGVNRPFQPMVAGWRAGWATGVARVLALILLIVGAVLVLRSLGRSGIVDYFRNFQANRQYVGSSALLVIIGLSIVGPAVMLRLGSWVHRPERRGAIVFLLLWLPAALFVTGVQGERSRPLAILFSCLVLVSVGYRRIRPRILLPALAVLLAVFVVVGQQRSTGSAPASGPSSVHSGIYASYIGPTHEFSQFRDFVVLAEGVPTYLPYQQGRTFLSVVPVAPFKTGGFLFSKTFYADLHDHGTSVAISLPAELYLNFGIFAVLLGLGLFGALLGALEAWFRQQDGALAAAVVYAYCIPPLGLLVRGDFTSFASPYGLGLLVLIGGLAATTRLGGAQWTGRIDSKWRGRAEPQQGAQA
jgi:oligosaccharide repeat unit polymerase